jgi:two-component system, chemotaxis family, chemotaxis protein CheY
VISGGVLSGYDFSRFTCLVVEDSTFIRSLIISCLNAMGVSQVKVANHGGEAIEWLKIMKSDPLKAGILSIDLIISDWEMAPVDGMMLLRWVRRHSESPNRFIPFVMITSHSDLRHVQEARDMGAHEVMGKPFSVKSLAHKIGGIVEHNRQFVHTKDYFGPDRRRRSDGYGAQERRELTDKSPGVEIVNG